jgi:beta-mannosidase
MSGRVRGVTGHTRIAIERGWEVAASPAGELDGPNDLSQLAWSPAYVPGTAASALPDRSDYDALDWWWRVPLDPDRTAGAVLGLDGIATLWDAWLDGAHVASGDSMWAARELAFDKPAEELVIRCRSLTAELAAKRPRPRWRVPMLEQQQLRWFRTTLLGRTPGWSPPWPAVGPWRPIWIERRVHDVGRVSIDASLDGTTGLVSIDAVLEADRATLVVTRDGHRFEGKLSSEGVWTGEVRVPDAALWWPHTHGEPARYHVAIEAQRGDDSFVIDLGHTGFRTIELEPDFTVRVNGTPVFCRGACWTPIDARTLHATPAQYDAAVARCARGGMNMLRVSGATLYEHDAFLDALDSHGVLLWQDLMFANMDYPDELDVAGEVREQAARWQARPSLAIVCGNSEAAQQAAMFGAPRERWEPPLFHRAIPELVAEILPRVAYVPSSACGGAFPHTSNVGPSSYYGVGAYRRPLDDARRAEVVFASECLAFANIGRDPVAKQRTPRDLGAHWDFDDVRDHYVRELFGVDPFALRASDYERYLALGRATTGEVMARTFAEWRRRRSLTRGGLVWFLRDLWPGAGWGVVHASGRPKPAWYALRRALAPLAVAITDEGTNGLALHVFNDLERPVGGTLELQLWRGEIQVGRGVLAITAPARGALEIPATDLLEGFSDLSYAYRFGPPSCEAIHASFAGVEAFWFPAGLDNAREPDLGLRAEQAGDTIVVETRRFARFVTIDLPGYIPDDDGFHLAPGQRRTIALERTGAAPGRGSVGALNCDVASNVK